MLKTAAQPRVELGFHLGERSRMCFFRICTLKKSCSGEESHILWQSTGWVFPNMSGVSSSAYPLRNENLSCLVSHVSTSLQRPSSFTSERFCCLQTHSHTVHTMASKEQQHSLKERKSSVKTTAPVRCGDSCLPSQLKAEAEGVS